MSESELLDRTIQIHWQHQLGGVGSAATNNDTPADYCASTGLRDHRPPQIEPWRVWITDINGGDIIRNRKTGDRGLGKIDHRCRSIHDYCSTRRSRPGKIYLVTVLVLEGIYGYGLAQHLVQLALGNDGGHGVETIVHVRLHANRN